MSANITLPTFISLTNQPAIELVSQLNSDLLNAGDYPLIITATAASGVSGTLYINITGINCTQISLQATPSQITVSVGYNSETNLSITPV